MDVTEGVPCRARLRLGKARQGIVTVGSRGWGWVDTGV